MNRFKDFEGVGFEHAGDVSIDWTVVYTEDGKTWVETFFDNILKARAYAKAAVLRNQGNSRFSIYAKRAVVVSTFDFLDVDLPPSRIAPAADMWLERHFAPEGEVV